MRDLHFALRLLLALLIGALSAEAQVQPNATWRTIETRHFRVTFTPELEPIARRAAASAEESYAALSAHFRPPRGTIDIVVADNVDYSNGSATAFPSNRIVVYANPPVAAGALRFADDPVQIVVLHELLHIFQLDRASGIWGLAQRVFGRSPYLFPNAYQPSWLLEGLAVRYESRLTGSGRIVGSEHRMIARTAAMAHAVPRLDQLSLANPRFPFAYSTYAYGSLFMDWLGQTHGDSAMRTYVEASSRNIIPMWINAPARRAFGRSLTRAYRAWTQALLDSAPPSAPAMPGWRDLTVDGAYANFPRWLDDSTLIYSGTSGRESYGLYRLRLTGNGADRTRLARRHTESPNSALPDGSIVYSQLEYADPYTLRSDLYLDRPNGSTVRLTRNARLSMPDARADGRIVAVQTQPGSTRLVLVSADGAVITPLTSGSLDEHWSEPRWSPDGESVAAIRWRRGGMSEVVVVDVRGGMAQPIFRARAVVATPSWSRDGGTVYFSSDHEGITNLYSRERGAHLPLFRVSDATTGLFEPQPSPNDRTMAAVIFRADGYHVGVAPITQGREVRGEGWRAASDSALGEPAVLTPQLSALTPAQSYSALRSLLPRYWIPYFSDALTPDAYRLGAFTSGQDLVGRHAYQALLYVPTDNSGVTGALFYRNAMLGRPVVELSASQDWENRGGIVNSAGDRVGTLRRRIRDASVGLSFERPKARTFSFLSIGGGVEGRDYATNPVPVLSGLDTVFQRDWYYPRVVLSTGWSNTQRPAFAISPEDGISLSGTARYRWRTGGDASGTTSLVGAVSGYKSLDLPGFGHHVLAARVAGGRLDSRGTGYLEVGGVSGGTLDVLPGYALGEGRRTFGVRGFPSASVLGMHALAGSVEYRAPLLLPGRGLGTLPLFLDRTSLSLFGDAGTAWCPGIFPLRITPDSSLCTQRDYDFGRTVAVGEAPFVFRNPPLLTSVGAELNVNAALLSWDAPFRYRMGVAVPVAGTSTVRAKSATLYFTVGASF
ncbi:MAG TPA: hypothetical protein VFO66_09680 [Gemmatimonadaceae bacterium]|nr:hypothetical protein [Gemmatimonadaceae bacterium]